MTDEEIEERAQRWHGEKGWIVVALELKYKTGHEIAVGEIEWMGRTKNILNSHAWRVLGPGSLEEFRSQDHYTIDPWGPCVNFYRVEAMD